MANQDATLGGPSKLLPSSSSADVDMDRGYGQPSGLDHYPDLDRHGGLRGSSSYRSLQSPPIDYRPYPEEEYHYGTGQDDGAVGQWQREDPGRRRLWYGVDGNMDGYVDGRSAKRKKVAYSLRIWQQPERARLCSFKEENETIDRRPVDPPPVVEMIVLDSSLSEADAKYFIRASIVHPTLSNDPAEPDSAIHVLVKTPTGADASAGEVIQTPERLRGLDGSPGQLCIFAKLSVRMPGVFRLKFTLFQTNETGMSEITSTISEPFEVFSPKLFKGMRESTALTRHLAAQGLKVKLRTDTSTGRHDARRRVTDSAQASNASTPAAAAAPSPPNLPPYHLEPRATSAPQRSGAPQSAYSALPHSSISAPPGHALPWRADQIYDPSIHKDRRLVLTASGPFASPNPHSRPQKHSPSDIDHRAHSNLPPGSWATSGPRLNWNPTSSADLAAFSLNHSSERRPPLGKDTNASSSYLSPVRSSFTTNSSASTRSFSPFSSNASSTLSLLSRTSSERSDTQGPITHGHGGLALRTGDDGIPILPFPFPSVPSLLRNTDLRIPPPVLPPIRSLDISDRRSTSGTPSTGVGTSPGLRTREDDAYQDGGRRGDREAR